MDSSDLNTDVSDSIDERAEGWMKRETWSKKIDFFLACIGFSVGLGNVWRFPYLCYKNGGGAFLIPYFLAVVIGGFPLFYMEIAVGQYMSQGGPRAWALIPLFQGIGVATTILLFLINCYYNVVLAWAFYYLFSSFTTELPWEKCGHEWNTPNCSDVYVGSSVSGNVTDGGVANTTDPVIEFWENKVLGISQGLDDPGFVKWDLALCLLLAWIVVYGCICKGVKTSGKVMYFTATSPYIFMFILLIRNCTLDGSSEGIEFYLKPNLTKLTETTVWVDAGTQIFFSWSLASGTVVVLGSYNKFSHNSLREAAGFSLINSCTSFLAGFIVFSILGFMAKQQNVSVSDVAESGPGLAFIAYPKAVAQLPVSPMWAIFFFIMLILLGLDSQFVAVEGVITVLVDQWPHILRRGYRREILTSGVCIVKFLIGLSMVTEGGMYVFQVFDYYSGARVFPLIALCEVIALMHCYGIGRFVDNLRMISGSKWLVCLLPYFKICWFIFSPIFCIVISIMSMSDYSELTYKRPYSPVYTYPTWGVALGWTLGVASFIWIPVVALYQVIRLVSMGGRLSQDFRLLVVPYSLKEHQQRPQDKDEPCLEDFERQHQMRDYSMGFDHSGRPAEILVEMEDSQTIMSRCK